MTGDACDLRQQWDPGGGGGGGSGSTSSRGGGSGSSLRSHIPVVALHKSVDVRRPMLAPGAVDGPPSAAEFIVAKDLGQGGR